MEQYIDKSPVVAEIKRRINEALIRQRNLEKIGQETVVNEMVANELNRVLTFINTLEVKNVDLEKEFNNYIENQNAFINSDNNEIKYCNGDSFNNVYDIYPIAKYFFEFRFKKQKGE